MDAARMEVDVGGVVDDRAVVTRADRDARGGKRSDVDDEAVPCSREIRTVNLLLAGCIRSV